MWSVHTHSANPYSRFTPSPCFQITENDAFIEGLRDLRAACDTCNKHEQVIVLIHACIDSGRNTKGRILDALDRLGWNMQHARLLLDKSTGNLLALHRWSRDADGVYRSHP